MEFASAQPDVIRAINQRWLLKFWSDLRGRQPLPTWFEFEGHEFTSISANLSFMDVVGSDGEVRFLIRYHGARIGEAYGSDCHGKFIDEILPARYRDVALATYREVVAKALPVYTASEVPDLHGRPVQYERLLLPFGRDGQTVDRILVSLEMVCSDGAFMNRELMKSSKVPSEFAVCATIRPGTG
jgi:hypothetical protein